MPRTSLSEFFTQVFFYANPTMTYWKSAGLSYLSYVNIASRAVRTALRTDLKVVAARRDEQTLRVSKWVQGKQGEGKDVTGFNSNA
ncbi:mitochondrial ATP synthase epsilon chain-domain-containing protein [Blastocladiella britannica]|nr:mitochondrial ATP synthase epsilon chain-domain-containing protein [Blastocladiella britannica]